MLELTKGIEKGWNRHRMQQIQQIAFFVNKKIDSSAATLSQNDKQDSQNDKQDSVILSEAKNLNNENVLVLHSFEECCKDKRAFAENFHWIETHANMMHPDTIIEPVGEGYVQINPPYPPATQEEMDSFWDLPFTKLPHPR